MKINQGREVTGVRREKSKVRESLDDFCQRNEIKNKALEKQNRSIPEEDDLKAFKGFSREKSVPDRGPSGETTKDGFKDEIRRIVKEELNEVSKDFAREKIRSKEDNERVIYIKKADFQKFQKTPEEKRNITRDRIVAAAHLFLELVGSLEALEDRINPQSSNNKYGGLRDERKNKTSSEN